MRSRTVAAVVAGAVLLGTFGSLTGAELASAAPQPQELTHATVTNGIPVTQEDFLPSATNSALFGANSVPRDFSDEVSDPLNAYAPTNYQNLYLSMMNNVNGQDNRGTGTIFKTPTQVSGSALNLDTMGKDTQQVWDWWSNNSCAPSGQESTSSDKALFEYQVANAVAFDADGDGTDELLQNFLYTGKNDFSGKDCADMQDNDRISRQLFQVLKKDNKGNYEVVASYSTPLADETSDDKTAVWDLNFEYSAGLTAMTAGDFDGDGNQEVAVYNPKMTASGMNILILSLDRDKGFGRDKITVKQTISLTSLGANADMFTYKYSDRGLDINDYRYNKTNLPVVQLATSHLTSTGFDELIINASQSWNQWNNNPRPMGHVFAVYRNNDAKSGLVNQFNSPLTYWNDEYKEDYQFRFAAATAIGMGGFGPQYNKGDKVITGDTAVVIGGYYNHYDANDKNAAGKVKSKGNLAPNKYLVQLLDYQGGSYRFAWSDPKTVGSLDKAVNNDNSMQNPISVAAGQFLPQGNQSAAAYSQRWQLFIGGVVYAFGGTPQKTLDLADLYILPNAMAKVALDGHEPFIYSAVAAQFVSGVGKVDQLVVVSGDHYNPDHDKLYLDISWFYSTDGVTITADKTNNDYYDRRDRHDGGTSIILTPIQATDNNYTFTLKAKSYGWSNPQIRAVLLGMPYYDDLVYGPDLFAKGKTTIEQKKTNSAGNETSDESAMGFKAGGSVMFGAGLLGNGVEAGGYLDADVMFGSVEKHMSEQSYSVATKYSAAPGVDHVIVTAEPLVTYTYSVWIPTMTVTQAWLNEVQQSFPDSTVDYRVGQVVQGHYEDASITLQYGLTYSRLTVDQYNDAVASNNALVKGNSQLSAEQKTAMTLKSIDVDKDVFNHVNGDPRSYSCGGEKCQESGLINTRKGSLKTGMAATVDTDASTVEFGFTSENKTEDTLGTSVKAGISAGLKGKAEVELVVEAEAEGEIGVSVEGESEKSTITTQLSEVSVGGELARLPESFVEGPNRSLAKNYQYQATLATWVNKGWTNQSEFQVVGPLTWGFSGIAATPKLPSNIEVKTIAQHEALIGWTPPEDVEIDHYELAVAPGDVPDTEGRSELSRYQTVASDLKHSQDLVTGLDPNTTYSFVVRSVNKVDGQNLPGVWSRHVVGTTAPATDFSITQQPQDQWVKDGESFTFSVGVSSTSSCPLAYQWQRYSEGEDSGEWADISGQTGDTFTGTANTQKEGAGADRSQYRVAIAAPCGTFPRIYSLPARLYVGQGTRETVGLTIGQNGYQLDDDFYLRAADQVTLSSVVQQCSDAKNCSPMAEGSLNFVLADTKSVQGVKTVAATRQSQDGSWSAVVSGAELGIGAYKVAAVYTCGKGEVCSGANLRSASQLLNVGQLNPDIPVYEMDYQTGGGTNDPGNRLFFTYQTPQFTLLPAVLPGKVFQGWFDESGNRVDQINPAQYAADHPGPGLHPWKLTARWGTWQITYDPAGGINDPANPTEYGQQISVPLYDATRSGYDFLGWYSQSGDKQDEVANPPLTGPVKLIARWQAKADVQVSFDSDGGTAVAPQQIAFGAQVTEPPAPTRDGYTFLMWMADGLRYDFASPVQSDLTLVAKWLPNDVVFENGNLYTKGQGKDLVLAIDYYRKYLDENGSVAVDGQPLNRGEHFSVDGDQAAPQRLMAMSTAPLTMQATPQQAQTRILVRANYLDTLAVGEHRVFVMFSDGAMWERTFTVADPTAPAKPGGPGDDSKLGDDQSDSGDLPATGAINTADWTLPVLAVLVMGLSLGSGLLIRRHGTAR